MLVETNNLILNDYDEVLYPTNYSHVYFLVWVDIFSDMHCWDSFKKFVKLTLNVDVNGMLMITARDTDSGKTAQAEINYQASSPSRVSEFGE